MAANATVKWDRETDVVIVGYGFAGAVSAITAHDAGAKVLLLEKMPHPGG
ncbi:MAG: FAD-dependent oxidoreductase, partial [Deltaproteobacteria bacterium]|nr:FAD-dependent oxidoreductase [Deltaproteobacteria bacterium]